MTQFAVAMDESNLDAVLQLFMANAKVMWPNAANCSAGSRCTADDDRDVADTNSDLRDDPRWQPARRWPRGG